MDTRSKIITPEQARALAESQPVVWFTAHFDPLLAEHTRRIRDHRRPGYLLIAVVTNPADPYLPQSARAELVAALKLVRETGYLSFHVADVLDAAIAKYDKAKS